MAHYHVGGFLGWVIATAHATSAQERHGVLVAIANAACADNSRQYQGILASCGCRECTLALQTTQQGGVAPCRTSQVRARFARDHLANLTPTFFRQCIQMHTTMPASHALLTAPVETETLSPTHARLLVVELQRAVCSLQRQGLPLPLSLGQLGLWHQFPVATHFVEAVDLVDGDGGYLILEHIPGLGHFIHQQVPPIVWLESMRGRLVAFRCHGHDALELEHVYHISDGTPHHLGYQALCAARRVVAEAAAITIHTSGEVDVHGRRLVCSIATTICQGQSTSIGESLLRAGLSYPLPGAPATFTAAFAQAEASQSGVFGVFPPSLAHSAEATPAQLRAALGPSRWAVELQYGGEGYKISDRSCLRSASHVMVWKSREEDAGQGAFIAWVSIS